MAVVLRKLMDFYHYVNTDLSDPRTVDYPMVSSPLIIILIVIFYNVFVQNLGPRWMEKKKPYNLKNVIVLYDLIQVYLNFYLFYKIMAVTYFSGKYNIFCQEVETGTSPEEMQIINCVYNYFLVKILDLLDTVFFLLSKKASHLSFLHIYHHSGMVVAGWIGIKFVPGGQAVLFGAINGFVHGVMYTYYLLAALKYIDSRHVVWKRCITQLQMLQFCVLGVHHIFVIFSPNCGFPWFVSFLVVPQIMFMFFLFSNFYYKTYIKQKPS